MTRAHQLEDSLKTLRLSGMLETLEARLAQATAGELGGPVGGDSAGVQGCADPDE